MSDIMPVEYIASIPEYQDSKSSLVDIHCEDTGRIHSSWQLYNLDDSQGPVIAYEYMPENYPAAVLASWPNKEAYVESVKKVPWIMQNLKDHEVDILGLPRDGE